MAPLLLISQALNLDGLLILPTKLVLEKDWPLHALRLSINRIVDNRRRNLVVDVSRQSQEH